MQPGTQIEFITDFGRIEKAEVVKMSTAFFGFVERYQIEYSDAFGRKIDWIRPSQIHKILNERSSN